METYDPIELLFGGMDKLGPGGDEHTRHVLRLLPQRPYPVIVDAGCGTGRQTLVLAKELNSLIHALDTYAPFLDHLQHRAKEAGLEHLIQTHCMDIQEIPAVFPHIDLLWSEGSAYNIGFANALASWAPTINPGGFLVVSELCWLVEKAPDAAQEFFQTGYPDMHSHQQNLATAEAAGYRVLATHTLPREAWVDGYYDILELRAKALVDHPDPGVRDFATETVREIEVFNISEDSYGYVFYVLQRAE